MLIIHTVDATSDDNENHEKNVQALAEELQNENPKSSTVKSLMRQTFPGRHHWIVQDSPSVQDVLGVFPCLNQSSRVSCCLDTFIELLLLTSMYLCSYSFIENLLSSLEYQSPQTF